MNACSSLPSRFGLIATLLLGAAFAVVAHAEQGEEFSRSYAVTGRATVKVHAQWGAVRVISSDAGKVQFDVTYVKRDWASDPPIESHQDGNIVTLTALVDEHTWWGWGGFSSHRLNIVVRMPRNADLQLQTTNGDIDVDSVNGHVVIQTRNGSVNAEQLSGVIQIGSTNGSITAAGVDGRCEVSTTNGPVRIAGRFESLDITSTNGGIVARAEDGSRMASGWSILTTNGGVDLALPANLSANLEVNTTNGRIRLDLPVTMRGDEGRNLLRGTLNGGGPEVSLRTTNANIHVRGI